MYDFSPYFSRSVENADRGGTAILIKNYLVPMVVNLDCSDPEIIKFQLKCFPDLLFVAAYIPPSDSSYFNMNSFSVLNELSLREDVKLIVMGDLNARFGDWRQKFLSDNCKNWRYLAPEDPLETPNLSAKMAYGALSPLVLLNNIQTDDKNFSIPCTFRKASTWISELDSCLVSPDLVDAVVNFSAGRPESTVTFRPCTDQNLFGYGYFIETFIGESS